MASTGLPVVLAVEVEAARAAASAGDLQRLIAEMATANRTWGEERIASELLLKLGIRVSPRTVRRYMPTGVPPRRGARSQTWRTFVCNHASAVIAVISS